MKKGVFQCPRDQGTCDTEEPFTHSQHTRLVDIKGPFTHSRCEDKGGSQCEEEEGSRCLGIKGPVKPRDSAHTPNIHVSLIPRHPSHTLGVKRRGTLGVKRRGSLCASV